MKTSIKIEIGSNLTYIIGLLIAEAQRTGRSPAKEIWEAFHFDIGQLLENKKEVKCE